jgi:hypothetical protein
MRTIAIAMLMIVGSALGLRAQPSLEDVGNWTIQRDEDGGGPALMASRAGIGQGDAPRLYLRCEVNPATWIVIVWLQGPVFSGLKDVELRWTVGGGRSDQLSFTVQRDGQSISLVGVKARDLTVAMSTGAFFAVDVPADRGAPVAFELDGLGDVFRLMREAGCSGVPG